MSFFPTFNDPVASLWQSAIDNLGCFQRNTNLPINTVFEPRRPAFNNNEFLQAVALWAEAKNAVQNTTYAVGLPADEHTELLNEAMRLGLPGKDLFSVFSELAEEVGKLIGDLAADLLDTDQIRDQLRTKFSKLDWRWVAAAVEYVKFYVLSSKPVPYQVHDHIDDFVFDNLSNPSKVGLVGDWGTCQPDAIRLLMKLAAHNPEAVVHLGDIYYSGTHHEVFDLFLPIWSQTLKCASYVMAGNHDLYCGGRPYYDLLKAIGQPASYFCLRNRHWQIIALDTGLHGCRLPHRMTYLEESELAWLKRRLETADGRRTILLTHHQLFSAYSQICGEQVNTVLLKQLGPLLPEISMWFWGHEHNFVVYDRHLGVRARCIGHGAVPERYKPLWSHSPDIPVITHDLGHGQTFFNHGYAMIDFVDREAIVNYYELTDSGSIALTFTESTSYGNWRR